MVGEDNPPRPAGAIVRREWRWGFGVLAVVTSAVAVVTPALAFAHAPALAATLALPGAALAQQSLPATLTGTVRDDAGPVPAVDITLERGSEPVARATTDDEGRFGLTGLPPARYTLTVGRLGYASTTRLVTLTAGDTLEVEITLRPEAVVLEGVGVEAARSRQRVRFEEVAGATVREMSADELRRVPGVAEADPIRAVEVLPGVVSTSDFSSAYHVRGGSQDQNLILLDGVPVFSPFHLGGFFSVFNADMVERAELASGGFPAEHGGRVSSVLSIVTDPGPGDDLAIDAGVSLLAARLAVAGGASDAFEEAVGVRSLRWRASARRSYFDQVLKPFFEFPYHLTDLQGVVEADVGTRDRLRLTAYGGEDVLNLTGLDEEDFPLQVDWDWGNRVAGLTWHRLLEGGRWTTAASYSRFSTQLLFPDFGDTDFRSRVDQLRLATTLDRRLTPWLRLGAGGALERFSYDNLARSGGTDFGRGQGTGDLQGLFVQGAWGRAGQWLAETGVRVDRWDPRRGEVVVEWSPRVSAKRFFGGSRWAVKAAAGRYTQFLHSLRDEELPLGLDVWILTGERAPHVVSDQLQAGVEAFPNEDWSLALEGYVRRFDDVVTFNSADDPNTDLDDVLVGDGTSWGADLFVRRLRGAVNGWLALSFLKARRTFPDPLSPTPREVTYPPIFDRRLDLDLVLRFPGPWGWDAGLRLNVGTGVPYTRPLGSYAAYQPRFLEDGGRFDWTGAEDDGTDGSYAVALDDRNAERYPAYHRLDLSFRKTYRPSWGEITPHLDILNLYNRRNVLFYFYEYERTPPVRSGVSMFPVVATVGVEVRSR